MIAGAGMIGNSVAYHLVQVSTRISRAFLTNLFREAGQILSSLIRVVWQTGQAGKIKKYIVGNIFSSSCNLSAMNRISKGGQIMEGF